MSHVDNSKSIIEIAGKFRVERGPRPVTAKATLELLGDATAPQYHAPVPATAQQIADDNTPTLDGKNRNAFDRNGKPIVVGEDFDYLDWVGFQAENRDEVFYLSQLEDLTSKECQLCNVESGEIWRDKGCFDSEEDALNAAFALNRG